MNVLRSLWSETPPRSDRRYILKKKTKMRVKELHPLCCITLESPQTLDDDGDDANKPPPNLARSRSLPATSLTCGGSNRRSVTTAGSVAGILYKWTNFSKGWRSRYFLLRNGILSYSKIRRPENLNLLSSSDDVRLIGNISADRLSRMDSCSGRRKQEKSVGIVHLKVLFIIHWQELQILFYWFKVFVFLHLFLGNGEVFCLSLIVWENNQRFIELFIMFFWRK